MLLYIFLRNILNPGVPLDLSGCGKDGGEMTAPSPLQRGEGGGRGVAMRFKTFRMNADGSGVTSLGAGKHAVWAWG